MRTEYEENREFEAEVRRVAEAVWGLAPGECQPEHYSNDPIIRELDGIAPLRDMTHVLMATVSRKLEKAKDDIKKLGAAERLEARRNVPVRKWLITKYQLEAQHANHAQKEKVTLLTLDQFRNRFFDGRNYIQKRRVAAFGSARNLADGSISIPENEYVPLPIMEVNPTGTGTTSVTERRSQVGSVAQIAEALTDGEILVLIAPFGSGKSLTTREIFLTMAKRYNSDLLGSVPIAVSLREHWGQTYGDEMLERHARSIGFIPREDVVVAWRAGIACLLLDGFDEMAAQVVAGPSNLTFMRDARMQSLQAVRDLISKAPADVGILVCGRDHYFDDLREMIHALGLTGRRFRLLRLGEFTEDQASGFLKRRGISADLPDWLPRKPLILGYLAHRGLLPPILKIDGSLGFGHAWDQFLTLICEREATHERVVMDPRTLRRVLERLACDVRATASGTGPITGRELAEAYRLETGQVPGEGVLMQLQRLPGLTQREQDPTARSFIDEDLLAALQGSAIARFVLENAGLEGSHRWLSPLSDKALAMAGYSLRHAQADPSTVIGVALRLSEGNRNEMYQSQLCADAVMLAHELARESEHIDFRGTSVEGAALGTIDIEDMPIDNLIIKNCTIDEVVLGGRGLKSSLRIRDCMIARVSGIASKAALPPLIFENCEVDSFDDLSTNSAVIRSGLQPALKALITVLRKLYLQAGGGRRLGALKRGLPPGPILDAVDEILRILEAENVVRIFSEVAHPIRRQHSRIMQILELTHLSEDPIVERVKRI